MILNHMHLTVRDLNSVVVWFEAILQAGPGFRNERMAAFSFDSILLFSMRAVTKLPDHWTQKHRLRC
jgi:hypothetical protein